MTGQAAVNELTALTSILGPFSISAMLLLLGLLSKRLGSVTNAPRHYRWFYFASILVGIGAVLRFFTLGRNLTPQDAGILGIFLYNGLPALGVTIGVVVAWRYWSWLLAERD